MKIRCGSHQQNRSIVRPGLSLMATKVALTAEEFRENSQRSIDLFNTEKLSTDSTRVLKSVYCNSVHFCRCNLRGACGGKGKIDYIIHTLKKLQSARSVWRQRPCVRVPLRMAIIVAICAERVEAKLDFLHHHAPRLMLQSARSVWRQSRPRRADRNHHRVAICAERVEAKRVVAQKNLRTVKLQSARSVWRQSVFWLSNTYVPKVAICAERVEAKGHPYTKKTRLWLLQSARSVWRQSLYRPPDTIIIALQSARSVWRQSSCFLYSSRAARVAICAERVEAKFTVHRNTIC